ncbi:MAG: ATP:cob(I)alamin adenosyltransferase [Myxococcota bacterium]
MTTGTTRLVGGQGRCRSTICASKPTASSTSWNAVMGLVRMEILKPTDGTALPPEAVVELDAWCGAVQQEPSISGAISPPGSEDRWPGQPLVEAEDIALLERFIDAHNAHLGILKSFVLPGGTRLNALLHLAHGAAAPSAPPAASAPTSRWATSSCRG